MTATALDEWNVATPESRNKLLEIHLGLVHHVARQMSRALSGKVELDDLVSFGITGLMLAVERFEPSRGLSFSTFAAPRIRGAILDELRRQDHVPRTLRKKGRELTSARDMLERTLCRTPSDLEVANHLGISVDVLWQWEADLEQSKQVRLDRTAGDDDDVNNKVGLELLADDRSDDIEEVLNREQEVELLRDAILALKEQDRVVLSLYYFEELKLNEIAEVLGVSESRVSQIRAKALAALRVKLDPIRSYVA